MSDDSHTLCEDCFNEALERGKAKTRVALKKWKHKAKPSTVWLVQAKNGTEIIPLGVFKNEHTAQNLMLRAILHDDEWALECLEVRYLAG